MPCCWCGEEDDHDADSLYIKPPQAKVSHTRDSSGSRRKEKSSKEKKHSKEHKHRDRNSTRDRERDKESRGLSDRRSDIERREPRRAEERSEMERYHHRSGYEREDSRDVMSNNDRRYQKHYERGGDMGGAVGGRNNHSYHHHQQQYHHQAQMHMQRQRQDYYERAGQSYHHGGGAAAAEYHGNRHQGYVKHSGVLDYGHSDDAFEMQRDRRSKYTYEQQKDAESLEQDLRSRLLSKRHKYVKVHELEEQYDVRGEERGREHERGSERSYEERGRDRDRMVPKSERHKMRREREKESVIEVLDSPEMVEPHEEYYQKRKHKRHSKETGDEVLTEKRRSTPDDPELLARRAKLLAAEREKERRKEVAREELQARRELRRERNEVVDVLSPTAVAASVTAGLNVIVKRKKKTDEDHVKRKRAKQSKHDVDDEDDDDEDAAEEDGDESESEEEDDEAEDMHDDSESSTDSAVEDDDKDYAKSKSKSKKESKNKRHVRKDDDSNDEEIQLPESPLSIGELSKSPKRNKAKRKHKHAKHSITDEGDDYEDVDDHSHSSGSHSAHSQSRSISHSRSRSRSPSHTTHSRSRSRSRTRSRSISGSHSSRSRSHSSRSQSRSRSRSSSGSEHSRSRSRSHSRDRSEERDMQAHKRKSDADAEDAKDETASAKKKSPEDGQESPVRDDNGVPLPNYHPGVQGCRSVEEFQCLNRIEEGTYGVVYRAKDKRTNEIVALKRLKMEKEKEGFPITSLREINTLLKGQHPNIVTVREIVVGSNMDKIFIVMDYVEHDLKSLMETMKTRKQSFLPGEVKCLTHQLLRAVGHLHDNWILHRDLKTSNLLLSHKGILKVGDFGLAREYGSPLKKYTSLVVTLWYRAPELLLGSPEYSTPIDIWSVGCIFAEFLQMAPMFPGKTEIDELNRIFKELGTPNEKIWPGYKELPNVKNILSQNSQFSEYPMSNLRKRFSDKTSDLGISLLQGLLTYDPKQRLNADAALKHGYFEELPLAIDPAMFPTWPAKSELGARKAMASSPKPPSGGSQFKQLGRDDILVGSEMGATMGNNKIPVSGIITGNKKTASNTGFVLNAGIDQRQLAMGPGFNLKF